MMQSTQKAEVGSSSSSSSSSPSGGDAAAAAAAAATAMDLARVEPPVGALTARSQRQRSKPCRR
jgi:hypothetical protein